MKAHEEEDVALDLKPKLVFFFIILTMTTTSFANTFLSFPGVRARAMGGAFTAVANDASAVWYNPAGLAVEGTDIIIEGGQALGIDIQGNLIRDNFIDDDGVLQLGEFIDYVNSGLLDQFDYDTNRNSFFLGYRTQFSNYSLGLFYYQPYTFDWFFLPDLTVGSEENYETSFGRVKQDLRIFGLAPAAKFANDRVKLGFTLELVQLDFNDSELFRLNLRPGSALFRDLDLEENESESGFSWSAGGLAEIIRNEARGIWLRLGATYRGNSSTDLEESLGENLTTDILEDRLFEKPASWDLGLSMTKAFTSLQSKLTVSAQTGSTDYGAANDNLDLEYDTVNLGGEYVFVTSGGWGIGLRGGFYRSEANRTDWPDVNGLTTGLEFKVGDRWSLSGTLERRSLKSTDQLEANDLNLISAAINYSF